MSVRVPRKVIVSLVVIGVCLIGLAEGLEFAGARLSGTPYGTYVLEKDGQYFYSWPKAGPNRRRYPITSKQYTIRRHYVIPERIVFTIGVLSLMSAVCLVILDRVSKHREALGRQKAEKGEAPRAKALRQPDHPNGH